MGSLIKKGWRPLGVLLLLLCIWEVAVKLANIPGWLLPAPSAIAKEGASGFAALLPHIQSTVLLSIGGFIIGCSVGILVAVVLHMLPGVEQSVYPLLILSQNVPIIVLAPLLVIWFGFGLLPKIIVITLVCFFPVAVASMGGFRSVPFDMRNYMLMAGASKIQIFAKLEWPYALSSVFSGLKISATYSVMGAVISEWLGAKKGLGVYMTLASSSFRTDRVFVAIAMVMALSLLFFGMISLAEQRLVKWRRRKVM
jgi:ABC-type nitrate/sulfonate/bicarbonate transport system permease component